MKIYSQESSPNLLMRVIGLKEVPFPDIKKQNKTNPGMTRWEDIIDETAENKECVCNEYLLFSSLPFSFYQVTKKKLMGGKNQS